MRFTAEDYRDAAGERLGGARILNENRDYAGAIYWAGLAVESMLRAYRMRRDPEFDARHDLDELLDASGLEDFIPLKRRAQVGADLGEVWTRWKNDYRFASNDRLLRALRKRGLTAGIRGDALKENARIVLESAFRLVNMGAARWTKIG